MTMLKSYLTLCFLCILLLTQVHAQQLLQPASPASVKVSEKRLQRIDNVIKQYIDSGRIRGAVGFIARDGKIVYDKAFGYDDIEGKTVLKTDAIFRIASQTKAITSVALMTLFEEGKFLLDDPVSKYIPEFLKPTVVDKFNEKDTTYTTIPAKREITIRDLLTHTSGIDYPEIGSSHMKAIYAKSHIPVGFVTDPLVLRDEIKLLAKLPLKHQPGEEFTYGLNTDILGYLIEVLSGINLDQFFQQRIFKPLGMKDTYFYLPPSAYPRLVTIFSEDKQGRLIKYTTETIASADYPKVKGTYFSGGAGLSSTIKDYAIFLQMLLNGGIYNGQRILSRHTVELMTSNQIGDLKLDTDKFGLGFAVTTLNSQAKLGISQGSFAWGGYWGTSYWADPKEHLVCLIFLQQSPLRHDEIHDKFRVLVYQALDD